MAMAAPAAVSGARAAAGKAKAAAGAAGDLPGRGKGRRQAQSGGTSRGGGARLLKGDAGKSRRMLIAEFIICVMILGLSPLAKGPGEMGPVRFMKRGSATCALFIILGLVSSMGKGAARAASAFGALVTLVLLVDQREIFGKLAHTLAVSKDDEAADAADYAASQGPPDDPAAGDEGAGVAQV